MKAYKISLLVLLLAQCVSNQEVVVIKTKRICWEGPESQYSHVETYQGYSSLNRNLPYTNYQNLVDKLREHERTRPFTENKHFIIAELKDQEIVVRLLYEKEEVLYTVHYFYQDDVIKKIVKESLGWRFIADIKRIGKNGWREEKYMYTSDGELILHAVFSISDNGDDWSVKKIYFDKKKFDNEYFENFRREYYDIFYKYGAYVDCNIKE